LSKNEEICYGTEQRGKCEGGKKPPSRSIKPEKSNFLSWIFIGQLVKKAFLTS
jgi:hypothetical protein